MVTFLALLVYDNKFLNDGYLIERNERKEYKEFKVNSNELSISDMNAQLGGKM